MLLLLNEFEEIEYTQLEKRIEVLENEIELIKQTISEGGGEVPPNSMETLTFKKYRICFTI